MITNAFKFYLATRYLHMGGATNSSDDVTNVQYKTPKGTTRYFVLGVGVYTLGKSLITNLNSDSANGIAVGSDDTAESANDYTLGSVISTVSGNVATTQPVVSGNLVKRDYILSVANTASSDITVREVGIFVNQSAASTQNYSGLTSSSAFMVDRTVLEEPITIPPGESASITYTLQVAL